MWLIPFNEVIRIFAHILYHFSKGNFQTPNIQILFGPKIFICDKDKSLNIRILLIYYESTSKRIFILHIMLLIINCTYMQKYTCYNSD